MFEKRQKHHMFEKRQTLKHNYSYTRYICIPIRSIECRRSQESTRSRGIIVNASDAPFSLVAGAIFANNSVVVNIFGTTEFINNTGYLAGTQNMSRQDFHRLLVRLRSGMFNTSPEPKHDSEIIITKTNNSLPLRIQLVIK